MVDWIWAGLAIASAVLVGAFLNLAIHDGSDPDQQARIVRKPRDTPALEEMDTGVEIIEPDPTQADDTQEPGPPSLKEQARALVGESDDETVSAVDWWIYDNIEYRFYNGRYPADVVWREKSGDCTGRAILAKAMLAEVGIDTRLVHGFFIDEHGTRIRHDWYEVKGKNYNYTDSDLEYVGDGIW